MADTAARASSASIAAPGSLAAPAEQSRARYPNATGFIERDGVKVFWERYGEGSPTILLMPTWSVLHSRHWKMQIAYLARHFRVVTFDGRGNGRSDRPPDVAAYADREFVADAIAVLDATDTDRALIAGLSMGAGYATRLAVEHPDRVLGLALFGASMDVRDREADAAADVAGTQRHDSFEDPQPHDEGWSKYNAHYWRRDWPGFAEWFSNQIFSESHSTKPIEDSVGWFLETDPETIIATERAPYLVPPTSWDRPPATQGPAMAFVQRVRCPALVVHGTDDRIIGIKVGRKLAAALGATFVEVDGGGHSPIGREPVLSNLLLRDFAQSLIDDVRPAVASGASSVRRWTRGLARRRRALYISSPIGLGHAQRDVSIADELRKLHPDLEIDWLAQHPVTAVLESRGERIHPMSAELASESAHITAESIEHDLNAFQAIRRMDEILLANFMVLHDTVAGGAYDLVIGDEAWDIDYYLHENPEIKRTAFVWMTDFVGWLPMPVGGEREAFVTADYNAEMIEHVERFPRIRDRAIFVGEPDDIVPDDFGAGLPNIRAWTERHYDFSGYVTGFDPEPLVERREELRAELGYQPDERVVIVTVGGSGVGGSLLRRVIGAADEAARKVNGLRIIAIAGPRIDPSSLNAPPSVEVRAFVPELFKHLAACDLAVVQGGLTTTMELAATRRPFLYFPLRNHFEQNRHVRHRLDRYGAGRFMDYGSATPDVIAEAIAVEIDRPVDWRPVERDGAARAAALIAPLL